MVEKKNRKAFKISFSVKQVLLISTILCFLFGIFFYLKSNEMVKVRFLDKQGKENILIIPVEDKEKLQDLMQKLFAEDSFAYTILGNKPVSWGIYHNPLPFSSWEDFFNSFSDYNCTLRNGWKTWEKYSHLFPSTLLWIESAKCYPGSISILLVNEEQFNIIVDNNKKDFEEVLQRKVINGSQLLKEAKSRSLIHDVLKGHQALIGTVLGYGRDNSWQFLEVSCKNRRPIGWVWGEEEFSFPDELPKEVSLTDFYLSHCSCPSFAGDPNTAESLELKKEYLLIKKKVMDYYNNKDFLEATLSLLAGHYPMSDSLLEKLPNKE